jgi:hypothetical protein
MLQEAHWLLSLCFSAHKQTVARVKQLSSNTRFFILFHYLDTELISA